MGDCRTALVSTGVEGSLEERVGFGARQIRCQGSLVLQ